MELSKVRKVLCEWLGVKHGTVYWISRAEIIEGIDKGSIVDIYMVKGSRARERYVVFYDYLNNYVRFAYDFQDWDTNPKENGVETGEEVL